MGGTEETLGGSLEPASAATVDSVSEPGEARNASDTGAVEETGDPARARLEFVREVTHHIAEGLAAMDRDGRILFLNRTGEKMLGWTEDDLTGKVIHDHVHYQHADGSPFPASECPMREAILTGATVRVHEDVFTRRDGTMFPVSYVCSPLYERDRIIGAAVAFRDMTDRMHELQSERTARRQLEFLAQASVALASSLDFRTTLAQVAKLAVPRIADWCVIDIAEPNAGLNRVAIAHADPEKVRFAETLARRYPPAPDAEQGAPQVIRTGKPELYSELSDDILVQSARDEEHLEMIRSVGVRSVMIVPLTARGRTFGAITLVSAESGRRFTEEDLDFAMHLARRSAVAVDNARLYSESTKVAQTLQQSLLPPHLPRIYGVELAARYHFAGEGYEVGGDFYDVFRTGRRRWAVVMGDVCGKGAEAAVVTGLARHTVRAAAMQARSPSRILARLNEAILSSQRGEDRFCTVVLGTLERVSEGIRFAVSSGGHPAPYVIRADGRVVDLPSRGTLLGIFPNPTLEDVEETLAPGDAVVLYTDGVTEARREAEIFGADRLAELLSSCRGFSAAEIAERIERSVLEFGGTVARDDIAVLVLKVAA